MKLDRSDWAVVLPLLDQALELTAAEHEGWLAALDPSVERLRPALRALLAERVALEKGEFLRSLPAFEAKATLGPGEYQAGRTVGPYALTRELGRGGMASVWLASRADGAHAREVALKLPYSGPRSSVIGQRFVREQQILSALVHPNIASVLDAGIDEGQPWLALEYVRGQPITEWADTHQLDVGARVRLFLQVLSAVQHAHTQLVIHRDLKPTNVLVDERGAVKLLDFGVAKLLDEEGAAAETTLTEQGGRALTPQYASPEQIAGQPLGTTSDVYSLGVLLYELLTGALPYVVKRTSLAAMEEAILGALIRAPSAAVPDRRVARALRGDLDTIVAKALERVPAQRYASAEALALDLQRHLESQPIEARPTSLGYRLAKSLARHRVFFAAATASLLALVAGLSVALWQAQQARLSARRAEAAKAFLVEMIKGSDARVARAKPRGTMTAKELLDENVDRIAPTFTNDPETQLELLGLAGEIYGHLGEDERSATLLRRRAELALAAYGPNHPVVLDGLVIDAWGSIEAQDYAQAMRTLDELGARLERAGLEKSLLQAQRWLAVGEAMRAQPGGAAARLSAYDRSIALYEALAPQHDELVAALANSGTVLLDAGRLTEARARYERALAVSEHSANRDDSAMAIFWGNLSLIEQRQGDLAAVEPSLQKAVALARATVGEDDPTYWEPATKLAAWVASRGDRARSEQLFAQLLSHVPETYERNTAHARAWEARGEALLAQGEAASAIPWLERALVLFEAKPYREGDLRGLRTTLGRAYDENGQSEQAAAMLKLARDEYLAKTPPASTAALDARVAWARAAERRGEGDVAKAEFTAVVEAAGASNSPALALAWAGLSRLALRAGTPATAVQQARQALRTAQLVQEAVDARLVPSLQVELATALATTDHDEARRLFAEALAVLERSDAEHSPLRKRALHGLDAVQ